MSELRRLADDWLRLAAQLGWGIEGPRHHAAAQRIVGQIAQGAKPPDDELEAFESLTDDRPLDARPVDALFEVSACLARAVDEDHPAVRAAHLSAARGWLDIARR